MKVAFILGFFKPVHDYLHGNYQDLVRNQILVSLPRQRRADLQTIPGKFKSRLFQLLDGEAKEVLVVLALTRDTSWIKHVIEATIEQAKSCFRTTSVQLRTNTDALAVEKVIDELVRFGIENQNTIPRSALEKKLGQRRVLFVWREGSTPPSVVLQRCGFIESDIRDFFEELAIRPGRNSNLIRLLANKAQQYDHLLYAWKGLRTLPPEIKRRFKGIALEASDTTRVSNMFVRWLQ